MAEPLSARMNFARRDARDTLRGRTQYTIDRTRSGMLHGVLLRSQVASAMGRRSFLSHGACSVDIAASTIRS